MPPAAKKAAPLLLVCGDDDFAVKQRARQVYQQWSSELGGMDHEILDASVGNSGEALKVLGRLREALQTLPFFGGGKVIWLKDCNFLGDERAASSAAVTENLASLAQDLKEFPWENVRLILSAGKVDKRKAFYKTLDKLGTVEAFAGLSADDSDWTTQAESLARKALRQRKKDIDVEALAELVSRVGPSSSLLESEIEKLSLYVGDRAEVQLDDVNAICTRNKTARAFALGDALGNRNLPELLRRLDEQFWEMKFDSQQSEIGVLYGLISKVRTMLLLKEMIREGWVKPEGDYNRFKAQLEQVPAGSLPADRRFNPLALNPYMLYKALPQVKQYDQSELVRAMDLLLQCNRKLVSSQTDRALVLQQVLVQIVSRSESTARRGRNAVSGMSK
ncbi:MAG TPA: DNA polymerase III subunit delta [Verrucomicrobiae bacterium]|nr:DNA polymerase III subunit delta [Verrucomicrobiae bacterium]